MARITLLVLACLTVAATLVEGRCYHGWRPFGTKCYRYFFSRSTWHEARPLCRRYKRGDLVVINNYAENNFVGNLATSGKAWIGMRKTSASTPFVWVDNVYSPFKYFAENEQNNSGNSCGEMYMYSKLWAGQTCSETQSYICEMPEVR
ncbi:C-type lectin lectoxin-Thr1-like [Antedon mediterranea]|uniref:C-type lectin lectoxin-Thr1-like n=1 Tax=Antedon mediterranea TaxID=105859 RepID=UPI003AF68513